MSINFIISTVENGVRTIQINRIKAKNAISASMFLEIMNILNQDANNDDIVLTILTGVGDFFSSGRDMTQTKDPNISSSSDLFENFITLLINYPKLLVAVVNGPAYGVAVTILGLCDIVYASERAFFVTPFVSLGLSPEACSTYTLPRILGRSKASEMLLLGEKLTAEEALQRGFVSKLLRQEDIESFIKGLHKFGTLPVNTVKNIKKLIIAPIKQELLESLAREIPLLNASYTSPEFLKMQSTIWSKRSKL